jgi:hypothetical protein
VAVGQLALSPAACWKTHLSKSHHFLEISDLKLISEIAGVTAYAFMGIIGDIYPFKLRIAGPMPMSMFRFQAGPKTQYKLFGVRRTSLANMFWKV